MPKPLVIVESPAKARTIAGFLGPDFAVASSVGHIRDLPRNASEVPPEEKGKPWARTGVDPEQDFRPLYVVPKEKRDVVKRLKAAVKDASELYLATDEDREGESIAWHVLQVCVPRNARVPVKRMVFHEITPEAIREALEHTRDIDEALVDAQETRRILDRLYGYEVSPVLWKKVMPGLSAGRVQSVAVRIIVERERERMRFRPAEWWDLGAILARGDRFTAGLVALDGRRLVTGRDFTEQGELKPGVDAIRLDEPTARELAERLRPATFRVSRVEEKPYRRQPAAPFMTSTLQQEAGRKLGFGAQRTMRAAQWLYENGYITYMRTDSTTLSQTALAEARRVAAELYGPEYVPERPRRYTKKVKNAQEAHEAIRPAGEHWRTPEQVAAEVGPDEARIYELVWKRTVASQMADAVGRTVSVRIEARPEGGPVAEFAASGTVITFPGFQRVYVEDADDADDERSAEERRLPALAEGDVVQLVDLEPQRHQTHPPPRYTEASLVKRLEELGVGRPSTYATIISTIQERGYVWKRNGSLVPSFLAFAVVGLLERHFGRLVDYRFTASMEDDLDRIANREEQRVPWLRRFYFGDGQVGLKQLVSEHLGEIDAREVNAIPIGTDEEGNEIVVRVGRYGPYIQRGKDRVPVPEGLAPDELTVAKALELLSAPSGERLLGTDPATGLPVFARAGRYGPYVQLGETAEGVKPKTASLFPGMSLDTVTLEDALKLLSLPRVVGVDPTDGEEITAQMGRFGPYLKKGSETRSLEREQDLFTIGLEEALALFAQPKKRTRPGQPTAPLRELGTDPATGRPIVVRTGRYGPYVTDGEVNATIPKGEAPEEITLERAVELLATKRAKGPAPKRARRAQRA